LGEDDGWVREGEKCSQGWVWSLASGLPVEEDEAGLLGLAGPVRLLGGEQAGEQGENQVGREFIAKERIAGRVEALLFTQLANGIPPMAGSKAAGAHDGPVSKWAGFAHVGEPWDVDHVAGVEGGEERGGGEDGGDPGQAELLCYERGGVIEFAGNHKVGGCGGLDQIEVGIAQMGEDEPAKEYLRAALEVVALADHVAISGVPVGADGVEGDALGFHYLPVIRGGGDGDRVAAALEFEAECEAGMQIAERPDGGEEDSLRLVLVRQSGLPGSASTWIIRCGGCRGHGPL